MAPSAKDRERLNDPLSEKEQATDDEPPENEDNPEPKAIGDNRVEVLKHEIDVYYTSYQQSAEQNAKDAYEMGRRLLEVQETLPYGQYVSWVKTNCSFSVSSSYNFVRLAEVIDDGTLTFPTVVNLGLKAAYAEVQEANKMARRRKNRQWRPKLRKKPKKPQWFPGPRFTKPEPGFIFYAEWTTKSSGEKYAYVVADDEQPDHFYYLFLHFERPARDEPTPPLTDSYDKREWSVAYDTNLLRFEIPLAWSQVLGRLRLFAENDALTLWTDNYGNTMQLFRLLVQVLGCYVLIPEDEMERYRQFNAAADAKVDEIQRRRQPEVKITPDSDRHEAERERARQRLRRNIHSDKPNSPNNETDEGGEELSGDSFT